MVWCVTVRFYFLYYSQHGGNFSKVRGGKRMKLSLVESIPWLYQVSTGAFPAAVQVECSHQNVRNKGKESEWECSMHLFLPPKFTLFIPLPCHLMIPEFYKTCCADDWSLITCAQGKSVIMTFILPFYPVSQDTLVFAIPYCSLITPENYCLSTVHPLQINLPSCLFQKIPWSYWVLLATFLQLQWAELFICILVERTILWDVKLLMICRFQASIFTWEWSLFLYWTNPSQEQS